MAGKFLTAEWRHLAMLNFEIDPEVLQPFVPKGTELDQFNGKTFVSVVGFRFLKTRVFGIPVPFHRDFDEVNLRFYVRCPSDEGVRRGVVFIKEIVPKRLIAWVARWFYNEKYVALPMRHRIQIPGTLGYAWKHQGQWNRLTVEVRGEPIPLTPGSEEEFITEHYWGYTQQRDGSTLEYQVEHPSWRVWRCETATLECATESLYGEGFVQPLLAKPTSVFVAEGSPVVVRRGRRLRQGVDSFDAGRIITK